MQAGLAAVNIGGSEVSRLQEKQRAAIERSIRAKERGREEDSDYNATYAKSAGVYPDLQDLSFGSLGTEQR